MSSIGQFQEILQMYRTHGWRLARVLMSGATLEQLPRESAEPGEAEARFEGVAAEDAGIDAMWFTRPSQGGREAWELRLVADTPYALFELFEPDESEEDRAMVRREMEAELKERMKADG